MAVTTPVRKEFRIIGRGVPRLDGEEKVRGLTQFADDIAVPNLWQGEVVRSCIACGRVRGLKLDPSFDWSRVVVVTPADIPGENILNMFLRDMPVLTDDTIQYLGEPLALVAAPTRALARAAAEHVIPELEELSAILTLQELVARYKKERATLAELAAYHTRKGRVEETLAAAHTVVTREYWCGHQEHMYIEPQSVTAIPEGDGGILIEGSFQCPYYITPQLCPTLNIPPAKLRVRQSGIGGAFGGKEEFPVLMAGHAALLALKCGKPVRLTMNRHDDVLFSPKRHPAWFRHTTGLHRDGTLAALQVELVLDGGGYTTISREVLHRAALSSGMAYRCDHVAIDGYVFRTNTPPNGAFRGFGTPQALWAQESHMDELAEACGTDPHTFRLRNCMVAGDATPTGGRLRPPVANAAVIEATLGRAGFAHKLELCSQGDPRHTAWYGIGMSLIYHGQGFRGDHENKTKSKVALELDYAEDGRPGVRLRVSSTEMGQGAHTALSQIVAEGLSIDLDRVRCPYPDTALAPNSGSTNASRTTMIVGHVLFGAAEKMKRRLEDFAARACFDGQPVELEGGVFASRWGGATRAFEDVAKIYLKAQGPLRVEHQYAGRRIEWDEETRQGESYQTFTWGCNVAEVEIDPLTFEIRVTRVTATYDGGRVINPMTAKGQLEGALVQALGYALMEKLQTEDGAFTADRMQTYVIPTSLDIPILDLAFLEYPVEDVWPGAKGLGELAIDGLAPAIANAVSRASGVRLRGLPITPEKLFEELSAKRVARGSQRNLLRRPAD